MSAHRIQIALVLLFIPIGLLYWYTETRDISLRNILTPGTPVVHIGDITHRVEIANSEEERKLGLSGRKDMGDVDGLLFVFPDTAFHSMWMKDMLFPIDIIWIDENLMIINIEKNVSPESYPRNFRPDRPARYAIETKVHYSDTFGILPGQVIVLPQNYLED
jgi:uncharacterized protein